MFARVVGYLGFVGMTAEGGSVSVHSASLLLEDGFYLLLETGDTLLLE